MFCYPIPFVCFLDLICFLDFLSLLALVVISFPPICVYTSMPSCTLRIPVRHTQCLSCTVRVQLGIEV